MSSIFHFLNPTTVALLALFLSVVWMLKNEKDRTRPLLVIALIINLFYGLTLNVVMGREDSLFPWKYDHILAGLDDALGVAAAAIAPCLQGGWRLPLWIVYNLMVPMMIMWYLAVQYTRRTGPADPGSVVTSYVAEMLTGPILYAILPACGPIYVFHENWLHPPAAHTELVRIIGMPNAFPSLHVGTAMVFVFCAPGKRWRAVSLLFLAGTALATISTGEHYVIDLVAGTVFGCFAASVGLRNYGRAALYLGVALSWSITVRFEYQFLIDHPELLRLFAGLTLFLTIAAVARVWRRESEKQLKVSALPALP